MTGPLIYMADVTPPTVAAPDSCALCGVPEWLHVQHYFGRHLAGTPTGFVAPDDETRLARMRARQEEAA